MSATTFSYISSGLIALFWRTISMMRGRPPSCGNCTKQNCAVTKTQNIYNFTTKTFFSLSPWITVATGNLLSLGWIHFCCHSMKKTMVFIQKIIILRSRAPALSPPTSTSNVHAFPSASHIVSIHYGLSTQLRRQCALNWFILRLLHH